MDTATAARATEPLRQEHLELLPHVEDLAIAADASETASEPDLRRAVSEAYEFLSGHLVPHARAEEAVLYPAVEAAMHAPGATQTMRRDHVQVIRETEALGRDLDDPAPIDEARRRRIRRRLYGLQAIVSLHFAKEEEIYLEILDRSLRPDEAADLFKRMEVAAASAR